MATGKVVFYSVAEYSDSAAKLVLEVSDRTVRVVIWSSENVDKNRTVEETTYLTKKLAYTAFKLKIADAVLGGWKIMNPFAS